MDLTRRIQGTARFGCFTDNANRNADIVCLLCVSYNFTDDPQMVRKGNNKDLENIKSSFHDDRHCHYQHLQSPKKEKLLHLLSEKDRLMRFFQTNDVPSVFVLIVLSHGDENGVIYTDYQLENGLYDTFTTYQIVDSMKKLQSWEKCLNLLIFAPCRGTLKDVIVSAGSPQPAPFPNKNSCKITNFPGADNFIIVYSTVEATRANRDRYGGTWLVSKICETLDDLTESTTIENFFSMVHFNINEISTSHGQTLEIVQTAHPKFKIYKNISNQGTGDVDAVAKDTFYMDTADSMKRTYYLWKSQSGEQLRRKRGVICGDCKHAGDIEKALRENLDFETDTLSATDFSLEKLRRLVQGGQCTMGCFLVCCFASAIEENKADKELCVQIGANRIKISDFVYLFVGPHNMEWIGRPKIFFFVRTPTATDAYNSMSTEFTIKATNQAGIFICVLNHENAAEKMENFLKNPLLRDGSTLQELAGDLLQECQDNESTPKSLIVSTLSYQLDFPVWSPNFVPPKFMVTRFSNEKAIEDENAPDALKEHYSYDELRWDYQKQYIDNDSNEYCVWVISSKSGSGKTTTLKELQCFTNRYQRIKKTAFVPLLRNFQNLQKSKPFDAMEFLQRTQALATNDDGSLIHERKVVIFLDGIDEVCPELKKEIMGIVRIFAQMKLPLLITSRPHEEKEILEALKGVTVKIIEIEPFEQERQIQLLRQITSKSEMECSQILYKLRQLGATDILKNPFHLTLILNFGTQNNIHEGSLFSVFEVVLEETIRETLMKKEPYDRNHYKFGVEVVSRMELLQKVAKMHQCDTICVTKLSDNDIIKINNTGVATVQNDKKTVIFYHQSYAEFLLAEKKLQTVPSICGQLFI
ncbi:uncharacterized protein LOC132200804 isoform X2 [Neocloeon triangulifer]|uniref:uncharacterized protein LOC132200804 isoform X2 n=1 Tax=Neocloeon triangulifer TaxID=2078957 RepID=UPI00286F0BA3|nr:uncharacterized protein LOC132200804 isoform X2 [Neocloeon triangulifer]